MQTGLTQNCVETRIFGNKAPYHHRIGAVGNRTYQWHA